MFVFYGVSGEGLGHAVRSSTVIKNLIKRCPDLKFVIFTYDRAYSFLKSEFDKCKNVIDVVEICGINFVYEKNTFILKKTIIKELKKIYPLLFSNFLKFYHYSSSYNPDVIISDYEPTSLLFSKIAKVPSIFIENITFMYKCKIDYKKRDVRFEILKKISNLRGDYNFITTLFPEEVKDKYKSNTFLIGPLIRDEVKSLKPYEGDYILVYQTSSSNNKLKEFLSNFKDEKFIVYGFHIDAKLGNVIFKKNSKDEFLKDLEGAKAVIINGGFSLLSEAIYLKKPVLSIPIHKQIEQEVNAYYLEKYGFGKSVKELNDHELRDFLNNLHTYRKNIENYNFMPVDFVYDIVIQIIKLSHIVMISRKSKVKNYFDMKRNLKSMHSFFLKIKKYFPFFKIRRMFFRMSKKRKTQRYRKYLKTRLKELLKKMKP